MKENFCTKKIVRGLFLNLMLSAALVFAPTYRAFAEGPGGKDEDDSVSTSQTSQNTDGTAEIQDNAGRNQRIELPHLTPEFFIFVGLEPLPEMNFQDDYEYYSYTATAEVPNLVQGPLYVLPLINNHARNQNNVVRRYMHTNERGKAAKEWIWNLFKDKNIKYDKMNVVKEINVILEQLGKPKATRNEYRSIGYFYNRLGSYDETFWKAVYDHYKNV